MANSASGSPADGRISNCGWMILNFDSDGGSEPLDSAALKLRDASSLPYTATIWPGLNLSFRYEPWNQMHLTVLMPWPRVISKIGPERVRSRTEPRTSPMMDAIAPG